MFGLTVRWSLQDAPKGTLKALRAYVEDESYAKFAGLEGLRVKTWRARKGEWFEGSYVFVSEEAREKFQEDFEQRAAESPGSKIVGSAPISIEACEIVAVVRGPAGFRSSSHFEHARDDD
ncbi:hypothetical protein J2X11_001089 [Aeromicrobium panaciterrae]|uniref:ABM domain-containing protein n=1 Tax=Aeromicrobium panaciterrae TaxID=363861 RepID=A0ABU1UM48_9ACTN|nr:hypothetical protein [Aeromicrobium panaciterrae]MDR7086250.1 hypothetical protein [Aeromicrobium panaciterrae]